MSTTSSSARAASGSTLAKLPASRGRPRGTGDSSGKPRWTLEKEVRFSLAALAGLTAVVHFAVAGAHFEEYWLFGVFMLAAAWAQLTFAVIAVAKPIALTWWSGAIGNALIVAVYVVTRTIGDVVGPTPSSVEPAGLGDVACTTAEALVVVGCVWLLVSRGDRAIRTTIAFAGVAVLFLAVATTLSISLVDGGSEMVMTGRSSVHALVGSVGMGRAGSAAQGEVTPRSVP